MSVATATRAPPRAPLRDPAARARATALVVALVVLWPLLALAEFKPWQLFESGNLQVMANFLVGFFPPQVAPEFLALLWKATLETLAIASAGIALAFVVAVPLAVIATRALAVARIGPGPGRAIGAAVRTATRAVLTVLRAIPEVVWALVFVRALGLGPGAGVLALAVTYGGMLGKVYTEILESGDTRSARALLEAGSPRLGALFYALVPSTAQELASYTVYRWECAVRASVVMGFVGAGGLGQLLYFHLSIFQQAEASTLLIAMFLLVFAVDSLSAWARGTLASAHG
jgi:phosphonate transport system permease protein